MTKEQLEDIEKFAEYRLRVGSADAAQTLLVSKALRNAEAENALLRQEHQPTNELRTLLLNEMEAHSNTRSERDAALAEIKRLNNHLHPKPEQTMSAKKLYEVTISHTYYAYAKDEHEARRYANDAIRDSFEYTDAEPSEVKHCDAFIVGGWNKECLVYHDGTEGELELGTLLDKLPLRGTR